MLRVTTNQSNGKIQSFLRTHGRIAGEKYVDSLVMIDAKLGRNQLPGLERLRPENIEIVDK
jgi:hypothetical protein